MRRLSWVVATMSMFGLGLRSQVQAQWLKVANATATAVGVLWPRGYDNDAGSVAGLARVLAGCRLERARNAMANLPACDLLSSGLQVGSDYALVFAVVPSGDVAGAVAFLSALLRDDDAGAQALSDDAIALVVARAALAADDSEFLYPGSVLLCRARARLGQTQAMAGPPAGDATAIAGLTVSDVRAALRRQVAVRVAGLGDLDDRLASAVASLQLPELAERAGGALAVAAPGVVREMSLDRHARTDSPYVSAVFAAPVGEHRAAFALGLEVARLRAFARWRLRGREHFARAPFVGWSWLRGDPLVQFSRRGEDPRQLLPGERSPVLAEHEAQATAKDLELLLEDLRAVLPSNLEMQSARLALTSRLRLPKPGQVEPWAVEPATLPGRLQVLLLATYHDVDVAVVDTVTAAEVLKSLRQHLRADRASWHALLPEHSSRYGYRRR